ncbi:MAG: hypothetical protein CMN30_08045 [Sandaracinus sp.]|nr:hypothetical protein [Sandaracinus sp.]
MAKTKKRLKRIEGLLERFAASEKRLVDLIVGLTVENLERRLGQHFERGAHELRESIVEELSRRLEGALEERVERAVLRALEKHRRDEAELERRAAEIARRAD